MVAFKPNAPLTGLGFLVMLSGLFLSISNRGTHWISVEWKVNGLSLDQDVNLWTANVHTEYEGGGTSMTHDDDNKIDDDAHNWKAFEINRGSTILGAIVGFVNGALILGMGLTDKRNKFIELFAGATAVVAGVICLAGAGYWHQRWKNNEPSYGVLEDPDEENYCAAGCGLEFAAGVIIILAGLAIAAHAVVVAPTAGSAGAPGGASSVV